MTPDRAAQSEWWEAPPRPALLIGAGLALGPQGLQILHQNTLDLLLAPVVPVALAAIAMLAVLAPRGRAALEMAPIVVAAVLLLLVRPETFDGVSLAVRSTRAVQTCGAALLVAVSGVLLLGRATHVAERRVVLLSLLLVLGGLADFTSAPALAMGALAAAVWIRVARLAAESATRDVAYLARPLGAALLVLTGAQMGVSDTVLGLSAVCIVVALAARRAGFGSGTIPGVYAIAVAVDLTRGLHEGFAPVVDAAAIAVITLQVAAFLMDAGKVPAPATDGGAP